MHNPRFALLLVALIIASTASALADGVAPNDAGSGADAGDDPAHALEVDAATAYDGAIHPASDADWYRVDSHGAAACAVARVSGEALAEATIASQDDGATPGVTVPLRPGHAVDLALAAPRLDAALLGLTPQDGVSVGSYSFEVDVLRAGAITRDSGGSDAADAPEDAAPAPGACFGGLLGNNDEADAYTVRLDAGQTIVASLATSTGGDVTLTLLDPALEPVATIAAGDVVRVPVDTPGVWTISATSAVSNVVSWVTGITDGDGPWPACRPACKDPVDIQAV